MSYCLFYSVKLIYLSFVLRLKKITFAEFISKTIVDKQRHKSKPYFANILITNPLSMEITAKIRFLLIFIYPPHSTTSHTHEL